MVPLGVVLAAARGFLSFTDAAGRPVTPVGFVISVPDTTSAWDQIFALKEISGVPVTVKVERSMAEGNVLVAPKWDDSPGP